SYTVDTLGRYFERALAERRDDGTPDLYTTHGLLLSDSDIPEYAEEMIAPYIGDAALLGQRTAEMHIALAGSDADQAFSRQSFTSLYQRSIYQSMRSQAKRSLELLRKSTSSIPSDARPVANQVLDAESSLIKLFEALRKRKLSAARIRTHGDFHLGQLLFTGKDFVIMDFEGEPTRSISERRLKRSPLRDVAGMLRSFHYAVAMARSRMITSDSGTSPATNPEDQERLEHWGRYWYAWVSAVYLKSYLATCDKDTFLPKTQEELKMLLDAYLLEKAIYEVVYELNNRPQWVRIPLEGILSLLETGEDGSARA
ncbi:MAG: phosphotransferase, partial [candidate division Zixibacteria bacterium]|nr:phosphotransferase [candidate division Zixibacteria bacterium]